MKSNPSRIRIVIDAADSADHIMCHERQCAGSVHDLRRGVGIDQLVQVRQRGDQIGLAREEQVLRVLRSVDEWVTGNERTILGWNLA